jgi:hypothetical protein
LEAKLKRRRDILAAAAPVTGGFTMPVGSAASRVPTGAQDVLEVDPAKNVAKGLAVAAAAAPQLNLHRAMVVATAAVEQEQRRRARSAEVAAGAMETLDETEARQAQEAELMRKRLQDPLLASQAAQAALAAAKASAARPPVPTLPAPPRPVVYARGPTPPRTRAPATTAPVYEMNKRQFDSWVAAGAKAKKWDALTPEERQAAWDTHIRQERLGNLETMIINSNDPVLKGNLPDPLHGTPNIHIFDKVYGRGV